MIVKEKIINIGRRKIGPNRQMSLIKFVDNKDNKEDEEKNEFHATPDSELPKNRLIEKLCNGMTLFV